MHRNAEAVKSAGQVSGEAAGGLGIAAAAGATIAAVLSLGLHR